MLAVAVNAMHNKLISDIQNFTDAINTMATDTPTNLEELAGPFKGMAENVSDELSKIKRLLSCHERELSLNRNPK